MSGFLLWFPGKRGASNDVLAACGLGAFTRDRFPEWFTLERGPDGRPGQLALWRTGDAATDPAPAILPSHDWQPCRADKAHGVEAGAYWLGLDRESPLRPEAIEHRTLFGGYWLKLRDNQQWHVPCARLLPSIHGLGDDGEYSRQVAPEYTAFWERSRAYAEQIFAALGQVQLLQRLRGGKAPPTVTIEVEVADLFHLAVEALALNYRINAELATRLKLFDDDALRNVAMLVVDLPQLMKHDEKKKPDSISIPVGSSISCGVKASGRSTRQPGPTSTGSKPSKPRRTRRPAGGAA